MAGADNRKDARVPLAAKVQIKTEGLDQFIEKFSANVSRGGIFVRTSQPLPMGREIVFTVVVPGGNALIEAKGKVTWVRPQPDPKTGEPAGMGIQFTEFQGESQAVLEKIVLAEEAKKSEEFGEAIDIPVDVEPPQPAAPPPPAAKPAPAPPLQKPSAPPPPKPSLGPALDADDLFGGMGDLDEDGETSDTSPGIIPPPAPAKPAAPPPKAAAPPPPAPVAPPRAAPPPAPMPPPAAAPPPQPAPGAGMIDVGGLDALMGDIEDALQEKPIAGAAATTTETLSRAQAAPPATARAPVPPPPPAPTVELEDELPVAMGTPISAPQGAVHAGKDIVLGIDLGTTYSCAAFMNNGTLEVVPMDAGYRTLPSVVTITANEQIVGRAAYDRIATHPKNTVYGSKRLLGRKFISRAVQDARKYFDYEIVGDENGNAAVRIDGEIYPLVMVTARILEEIRQWARRHFGRDIAEALITVPAYYNDNQRNAVIEAGRFAGFEVKRIVNEPVAAALAYGFDKGLNQKLLVYDLGGGTFDVSVMELNGNIFDVIAAGGDPYLGGVDFDNRIVDHLSVEFRRQSGIDVTNDKVAILRLRAAAESAKRDLSEKTEVRVQLPYLARRADGNVASLDLIVKRSDLERISTDLVDKTVKICDEVLHAAGIDRSQIDAVLLVGGQTRMPLVQQALTAYFGKPPRKGVHPDEAVAMGAALLASSLQRVDSVVLLDVVSMSIGIALPGGAYQPVLLRNVKLPATGQTVVATTRDGQQSISVDIFQGDHRELSRNDYLGTLELESFPSRPAGQIQFEISFRMDAQGFLVVIAKERASGVTQQMTLRTRETPEALHAAVGG